MPWDWLTGVTGFLNVRRCRKHLSETSCLCRNLTGGGLRDDRVLHVENESSQSSHNVYEGKRPS